MIKTNLPAVTFSDIPLRLCYCSMIGAPRAKTVAAVREGPNPAPLENLHHRLLNQSIQHCRDAKLLHPPSGLGISTRHTGFGSWVPLSHQLD